MALKPSSSLSVSSSEENPGVDMLDRRPVYVIGIVTGAGREDERKSFFIRCWSSDGSDLFNSANHSGLLLALELSKKRKKITSRDSDYKKYLKGK